MHDTNLLRSIKSQRCYIIQKDTVVGCQVRYELLELYMSIRRFKFKLIIHVCTFIRENVDQKLHFAFHWKY